MKLATYDDGSRDGQLVVVSRDLQRAHHATHIASRLAQVLDDWNFLAPQLQDLAVTLDQGKARHAFPFEPARCRAPLPRTRRWVSQGAPGVPYSEEAADATLAACDGLGPVAAGEQRVLRPGWAAVCGDIPAGATAAEALEGVRLLLLTARVDLCGADGSVRLRLGSLCAPVAVTPDEAGPAWQRGRLDLCWQGSVDEGAAVTLEALDAQERESQGVGPVLAALARRRAIGAGTVVELAAACRPWPAESAADQAGQRLHLWAADAGGECLFGRFDLTVEASGAPETA